MSLVESVIEIVRPEMASPNAELGTIRRSGARPQRQIRPRLPPSSALASYPGYRSRRIITHA